MTTLANEHILAQKNLNMLPSTEFTGKSFGKTLSSTHSCATISPAESRVPLSKTASCSTTQASSPDDSCAFISAKEFAELFSSNSASHERRQRPVIIDCRSQMDFGSERIVTAHNLNCRAKLMAKKLMSKPLEGIEANLSRALAQSDSVILYDQSTDGCSEEKIRSSPLHLVVQAARRSNKRVYILQGGLAAIKSQHAHLIQRAQEVTEENDDACVPSTPDTLDKENFAMTEILPRIFVGNIRDSQNLDRLSQYGITHIINATPDLPCFWDKRYQYLRVAVLDLPSQNIRQHFDRVIQFIDAALSDKKSNVLVHCSAGISRSPTLVLAYMMKKHQLKLDDAFNQMRRMRRIVDPNMSFIIQLQDWENKCITAPNATESMDNAACPPSRTARPTSSSYCGSRSRSRAESNSRTDAPIIVQ